MKLRPKTVLSGVPVAVEIYESRPFRHTERVGACVGAQRVRALASEESVSQNTMARC